MMYLNYHAESGRNGVNLVSRKTGIILNIWQESSRNKYNYLVLYTPPDRKSIAIEPITSNIDSFNSKEDVIILNQAVDGRHLMV